MTSPDSSDIIAKLPNLFAESPEIGAATLHYDTPKSSFVLSTTRTGTFSAEFPPFCMHAFGATDDVCGKLQTSLRARAAARYRNIACGGSAIDPAGCACTFDLSDRIESRGTFLPPAGATITHLPGNNFPEKVRYCLRGDTLELTGADGAYLFDRLGLRTLSLQMTTVDCANNQRDLGEDGVDCGPACPILCSAINCADGVQGPGEAGVDCGPNCPKPCP